MRILDRLLLAVAGLSLLLILLIFFSEDTKLQATPHLENKQAAQKLMAATQQPPGLEDGELRSEDVERALERYFEEIRRNPERGEEDLRLVDELVPDEPSPKGPPLKNPPTPKVLRDRVEIIQHTVQRGESIWRLAQKYRVQMATIISANKIKEKSIIQPGDVLRIPDRDGIFHKPQRRETLQSIAKRYKVSPEVIRKANGITGNVVPADSEIFLPGAKPLPEIYYVRRKVFVWPIAGTNRLTSRYGWRVHPVSGNKAFHTGIDIGAPHGTPIVAAADGVVVFAGDGGSYGNMVILRHKNGLFTVYGHASKILVNKGNYVRRGQKIARVGSTGTSTGPHLHFEVKSTDRYVNPMVALRKTERVAVARKI
ncbi:MAG: M23 family metallopeptidase [Turneriella sp.]|nr:M23 family metallopeptidase [Turneriella sp.]